VEATPQEIAARKFLKTGRMPALGEEALAVECDRLIQKTMHQSLKAALPLARKFALNSIKYRGLRLTAYRALARVTHMSGNHREALKAYLKARSLAEKEPLVRARIDRALIDVYMYLGDFRKSQNHARSALRIFATLKAESDRAQTWVNFGNLLHRQDKHRDAEKFYRQAAEFFEKTDNKTATARCYYNRANTLVQLFDFPEAERLYRAALEINTTAGFMLEATDARYGLAWLRMLEGKFHEALLDLNICEKAFRAGGDPRGEALCILDRAEVYLGLGLYHDALYSSRTAQKLFYKLKLKYEHSKASLFRGQAASAVGLKQEARTAEERALKGFYKEKNKGFLGVVHLLAADLAGENAGRRRLEIRTARHLFRGAQLPLWKAVCDLRLISQSGGAASAFKRLAANPATKSVPHLFTAWQTAFGDYKYNRKSKIEARRHWKQAADRLDMVRAQLPPLELRGAYARRFSSPHLRLIAAELEHSPQTAAVWSERYKTAGLWAPIAANDADPARRRVQDSLARLASEIAALSSRIAGRSGERNLAAPSEAKALLGLQKRLREEMAALEKMPGSSYLSEEELGRQMEEISHRFPVLQFHLQGNEIIAFIHRDGKTTVRRYPDGRQYIAGLMQRWQFVLESEILSQYLTGFSRSNAESMIWQELGNRLWRPLNIPEATEKVLIISEGELANLPWPALIVDGAPLMERHHFIHAPSIRHFLAAEQRKISSAKVSLFRGKAIDLPSIDRELSLLLARAGARATIHNPCRRNDWISGDEAALWHYSGHAVMRNDNPFYSYLSLEDGPIFAADFRLMNCNVNLVTLAACRSGEEVAMPGEESTGLVRSLLEMGAKNIIASHWPVSDDTTAFWMKAFYDKYFNGDTILDASRYASEKVREQYPSAYYWAAFSISGAGDIGE
jgi:CHAT domain/Tetratricopeptide repeat